MPRGLFFLAALLVWMPELALALDLEQHPRRKSLSQVEEEARVKELWKNDPIFAADKRERTEKIRKEIGDIAAKVVEQIYDKKTRAALPRLKKRLSKETELLLLGSNEASWVNRLSKETGSLTVFCDIWAFVSNVHDGAGEKLLEERLWVRLETIAKQCGDQ